MNLSTCFSIGQILNEIIDDYAKTIPQVDDTHSVFEVVCQELCVRVMAAAFTAIGVLNGAINSVKDLLELNVEVIYARGLASYGTLKVNMIFFRIIAVSVLSLAGAIIAPHYVHSDLEVLEYMRQDFCRLLTELPEDLQSLARSVGVELPVFEPGTNYFENWREKLAHHLEVSLPDVAEPAVNPSIDPPSFVNFHPNLYRMALSDFLEELQLEIPGDTNDDPVQVANWVDSKIEENPDYKKLLRFYAKEHRRVPTENSPQVKELAQARLEIAFGVSGAYPVRKKMRSLFLLIHPDKTSGFTERRKKQLTDLFRFTCEFTKYAVG